MGSSEIDLETDDASHEDSFHRMLGFLNYNILLVATSSVLLCTPVKFIHDTN